MADLHLKPQDVPTPAPEAAPGALTVTVEGTTYTPTTDGFARLKKPSWYTPPTTFRPRALPTPPRARRETVDAWAARLEADMRRVAAKDSRAGNRCEEYTGRAAGGGYVIVATDGFRALLRKGTPTKAGNPIKLATKTPTAHWFDVTDDMAQALHRMRAAGNRKKPSITIAVDPEKRCAIVTTCDHESQTTAGEWFPVTGKLRKVIAAVNPMFMLDALGAPGQRVYLPDFDEAEKGSCPIMLDTANGEYRLLVMPLREGGQVLRPRHVMPLASFTNFKPVALPARPAAQRPSKPARVRIAAAVPGVPPGSVTVAASADVHQLTPGQKARQTLNARIAAGQRPPVDWVAAGRKAYETRMRNAGRAA